MTNNIDKNSAPKRINKPAALKKTKIRLRIECTGFLEIITKNENKSDSIEKK